MVSSWMNQREELRVFILKKKKDGAYICSFILQTVFSRNEWIWLNYIIIL